MSDKECLTSAGIRPVCDERFANGEKQFRAIEAKLDAILESINGNGKPGLKSRLYRIELIVGACIGIGTVCGVAVSKWALKVYEHIH